MPGFRLNRIAGRAAVVALLVAATDATTARAARAQGGGSPVPAGARAGTISGTVHDTTGAAVSGARVSAGAGLQAVTDSSGGFTLRGVPTGAVTLTVHRLGFEPDSSRWQVGDAALIVDRRLTPIAETLPAVRVRARAQPFDSRLAGFNARRAKKLGYYLTREQIEQRSDMRMLDALRRIPGVRVITMRGALGRSVTLAGSRCPPLVMVDGFPASLGSFDLDMIDLATVEGVEVYPNGSSVPSELAGPHGMESCGLIAIWSAPMRPNVRANQLPVPVDVAALLRAGAVYPPDSVDQQARYIAGSARATYPDSLLRARVSGRVVARFVVDTAGDVEPGTIGIVSSSNAGFEKSVRAAVLGARFHPAQQRGRAVRQVVQLPFDFDPSAVEAEGKAPPEVVNRR
ncbi:MAG TPA: TonB family protein [Gemmatimonadaceae bacterium]|nr:TonB family protein [Gemmatimonadaceae bacterium]